MPLDRAALTQTDRLTQDDIPGLSAADGEYIELKRQRPFTDDMEAEMLSYRRLPPLPRPGETEAQAAAREPELRRNDAIYYHQVWHRNCVRLHLKDTQTGLWLDADEARPAGTVRDRDDVWEAYGSALLGALLRRDGSIIGAVPEGRVNAMGEPAKSDGLPGRGAAPDEPGAVDALGAGPGGAGIVPEADPGDVPA